MNSNDQFHFKQFSMTHGRSSMKIGVDGVLVGAWGNVEGDMGIDIGCGCGLIALMAAQRNSHCRVDAVDIDAASVEEAGNNFINSPWSSRLRAINADIFSLAQEPVNLARYDFILSNPPFFINGPKSPVFSRAMARHAGTLSPDSLLEISTLFLRDGGTLSMILPFDVYRSLPPHPSLNLKRICMVADRENSPVKRVLLCFEKNCLNNSLPEQENLFIRTSDGKYSEEYKSLTKDFYLNF